MVTIAMEWALWSERPGARADYTVLSCSKGQLRPGHFKKIITRFSPGTAEVQGGLPRVTIITVDVAQEPHIGMAIQDRSDQHDGTGRRIAPTRFFLMPYKALEGNPVSYYDLYLSLHSVPLPEAGESSLLQIEVPDFDASTVAEDITLLGADPTFAAAHLLHNERLCVTGAEQATTEMRLRYLDAAVSLLPYGHRAKITATTWANGATRHLLRMFFSRRANDSGTVEVPWDGSAAEPPAGGFAGRLNDILARYQPVQVIGQLALRTHPRTFEDAPAAAETLASIEERLRRDHALLYGDPTTAELRKWLDAEDLVEDEASSILAKLLPKAQGKDIEPIARWLPIVAAGDLTPWRGVLLALSKRLLWREGARLAELLRALRDEREIDAFLADLIATRPEETTQVTRGLGAIAQLLMGQVVPDPGAYPRTQAALTGDGAIALALIDALLADGPASAASAGIGWAFDRLPDVLIAPTELLFRVPSDEPFTLALMEDIAHCGASCVSMMLNIACWKGKLDLVAEGFMDWLVSREGCPSPGGGYWGNVLSALIPDDHSVLAMIDVALLATSHRPRWMMEIPRENWRDYQDSFAAHWSRPWSNRPQMIVELAGHLRNQSWHDVPGRATQIISLLPAVHLHEQPTVQNALIESLSNAYDLSPDADAEMWLETMGGRRTSAKRPVPAQQPQPQPLTVSEDPPRPTPYEHRQAVRRAAESLIERIVAAALRGDNSTHFYAHLSEHKLLTDAEVAVEIVASLTGAIGQRVSLNTGYNWTNNLIGALCQQKFGAELAEEFKTLYLKFILEVMSDQIRQLQIFSASAADFFNDRENAGRVRNTAEVLLQVVGDKGKAPRRRARRGRDKPKADGQQPAPPATLDEAASAELGAVE
ncbi:hypothetical protein [Actinomadura macra]|uniref:hypothetical protein n=1 Tax=Actinomadura macra TaxID=46164 RepID=UPI000834AD59|nr:hypothetical protein [Actinomadura macra]